MGYLTRMRFQTLKIDRSFVAKVRGSDQDAAVVDGMIRIAHGLGLQVVCEGIETAEECSRLNGLGCDLAQGYYFDPPLPIETLVERWLRSSVPAYDSGGKVVPLRVERSGVVA
jgi:EAL domain-containing protein (putative c-di-GMP-specific phosphodiesterase class I)